MRRRTLTSDNIIGKKDAVAGDILCAKEDGSKMVFKAADYADIDGSGWTPIGVVVIPPRHNVYGTGEGAVVSLRFMDYEYPDTGTPVYITQNQTYIGLKYCDIPLTVFDIILNTDDAIPPTISIAGSTYLPSDWYYNGVPCVTDPTTKYDSLYYRCPSIYLSDGSRNEDYYTTEYGLNVFSDFDGVGNTNVFLSLIEYQSDWKTASTIENYTMDCPAASCCWRYHTTGTNQGDWYIPAMGELGYLMTRLRTIDNSMGNLKAARFQGGNQYFASSTIGIGGHYTFINTYYGAYETGDYDTLTYVRSFLRF